MLLRTVLCGLLLVGCTKTQEASKPPGEGPGLEFSKPTTPTTPTNPTPTPTPTPTNPAPASPKVAVELTAVTLADDCGGSPPSGAPVPKSAPAAPKTQRKADSARDDMPSHGAKAKSFAAKRRCEQTSMQLSIVSDAASAATAIQVKSAELFDEKGASLGVLAASKPTFWSSNQYAAWDQKVAPGADLQVSYVLAQPNWSAVQDRWNGRYTLKVTVVVGTDEQQVEKDGITVHVQQSSSLPPGVKT